MKTGIKTYGRMAHTNPNHDVVTFFRNLCKPHRAFHLQVVVFGCSDRTTGHQMLSMILMNHGTTQTKFDCVQIGDCAIGTPQTPLGRKVRL